MTRPIVYAMPFREELDMLHAQLVEHAERVHRFVIMEATVDHAGVPKPLVLAEHWDDDWLRPYRDKIEYVTADWMPLYAENSSYWWREQKQRDIGLPYILSTCDDDTIVWNSDIDEFIPRSAYDVEPEPAVGFMQKLRYSAVDWDGSPGVTATACRAAVLRSGQYTLDTLRQQREHIPVVEHGGYHFSWFGGPERIERKAVTSPHQETLTTNLRLAREGYAWQRGLGGIPDNPWVTGNVAEITDDYPQVVRDRTCPWYWWRPMPLDNLPFDDTARLVEVRRRNESSWVIGNCGTDRLRRVRYFPVGSYHTDDFTPCPTAAPPARLQ